MPPSTNQAIADRSVNTTRATPYSISRRLDDMLSMLFVTHIISYEPPRGFMLPKFIMYDGTSDPFDHIMHFRSSKQSISLGTPFFEFLAEKPPITMDDLFKRTDKYSMLEDDVKATSQQVLVTNQPAKNDKARSCVNWVLQPHKDALILTLGANGSLTICLRKSKRLLSGFNGVTITSLGDIVLHVPIRLDHNECTVLNG
ncbi:hypothetical protein CK203_100937 [Vitis vinifera]|uniref:Uncharacterized protein n=1 Tax=Vitis vinifera TaxID=29760 RepID=A0A438CJD9_VITVI|nr:hypothetical protein CK203_100937 [Vitis vinifera]